jgi:hypothetical protein
MDKGLLRGVTLALALLPFVAGAAASAVICGAPLSQQPPPAHDDSVDSVAPPDSSPQDNHEKTQEVTYEPWELVST